MKSLVCVASMVKGKTIEIRKCNVNPNTVKPSYLDQIHLAFDQLFFELKNVEKTSYQS